MAGADEDDKLPGGPAAPGRHVYGPRAIGALVPGLVKPAFGKRAPATAQVVADWELIVGPAIAAVSVPRKLFSGTLAIGCSGPLALELQHLAPQLIERINRHLGRIAVTRLRFVQDAPAVRPTGRARVVASAGAAAKARAAVCGLPPGDLRDALEALGRAVHGGAGRSTEANG